MGFFKNKILSPVISKVFDDDYSILIEDLINLSDEELIEEYVDCLALDIKSAVKLKKTIESGGGVMPAPIRKVLSLPEETYREEMEKEMISRGISFEKYRASYDELMMKLK